MKILRIISVYFFSLSFFTSQVWAAKAEIKWDHPEKYHDINPGDNNRKSFQDHVFTSFEKHFAKLAMKLPADQILKIDVTDVDLAGDVNFGSISRIRIVTELFFPRMKFSYQLVNADKSIAESGEINLKDMNFMMSSNLRYRNDTFGYDKQMIEKWFYKEFKTKIDDNNNFTN